MDTKEFDELNIIPLVDVMLVLLTIVLTTSTFIAVGAMPVELPKAENAFSTQLPVITIEIDAAGTIFLDKQARTAGELKQALLAHGHTTPVTIRSDRRTALEFFVTVMDVVKGLGFSQVSLQTEVGG